MAVTITEGVNSYVTEAYANAFMEARLDASAWASDAERNKKALIQATRTINNLRFIGERKDAEQTLEFPRCYDARVFSSSRLAPLRTLTNGVCDEDVPACIKDAVCVEALAVLTALDADDVTASDVAGIKSVRDDSYMVTFSDVVAEHDALGFSSKEAFGMIQHLLVGSVDMC